MTSSKDVLKDALCAELEQKHHRFVRDKLGSRHPLVRQQEIRSAKASIRRDLRENDRLIRDLGDVVRSHQSEIKRQALSLRKLNVDEISDSLSELKDAVAEVREVFADSVGNASDAEDGDERH